jgi:hypothetical protein
MRAHELTIEHCEALAHEAEQSGETCGMRETAEAAARDLRARRRNTDAVREVARVISDPEISHVLDAPTFACGVSR